MNHIVCTLVYFEFFFCGKLFIQQNETENRNKTKIETENYYVQPYLDDSVLQGCKQF